MIQDIKVTLGNRIQDIQHCKLKIKQNLSRYENLNHVVIKIMQCIFTILFIVSIKGKNAKINNDENNITLNEAENEHECDLYNVRKDRFGLPKFKGAIPGYHLSETFISKCYPKPYTLQIIHNLGAKSMLSYSKMLTLVVIIKMVLLIMVLFNLKIGQNITNDSNYIPKSERRWYHGMTVKLHYLMENIITKGDKMTNKIIKLKYKNYPKGSRTYNALAKARTRSNTVHAFTTTMANQTSTIKPMARSIPNWDSDSGMIGIDNRCSACMSHIPSDFIGPLHPSDRTIKGFGGTRHYNVFKGTIKWHWEDDNGKVHQFTIPNSFYVPEGGVRLLSPQHWAQSQRDTKPKPGTKEVTTHDTCTLKWKQGKFKRTTKLSKLNNVAIFWLALGFREF